MIDTKALVDSLRVVGAIEANQALSVTDIASAVRFQQTLARGTVFTGRVTTNVYADEKTVVKLRSDLHFNERDTLRWVERTLQRERDLDVYHPAKTWFISETPTGSVIGNATPRLVPLHTVGDLDQVTRFTALEPLFKLYFSAAVRHECRLDDGLSNFGLDESGRVYYLDDDLYPWDDFTALTAGVGSWLRFRPEWRTPQAAERLGGWLRSAVLDAWGDRHQLHVLAAQLRQVFMADDAGKATLERVREVLLSRTASPIQSPSLLSAKPVGVKFALLADVHANLPALQAVLADLDKRGIDEVLVLGDVVGYGPHPSECIAVLRERGYRVIQGNHDYGVATGNTERGFSRLARTVVDWTRERLNGDELSWLGALPPFLRFDDWLAVHGAPIDKQFFYGYVYHMTYADNLDWLAQNGLRIAFHGHTHISGAYLRRPGKDDMHWVGEQLDLTEAEQILLCPGSVGQPRGGRMGAEYAVIDRASATAELLLLDYDWQITARDLSAVGLPSELSLRLQAGR